MRRILCNNIAQISNLRSSKKWYFAMRNILRPIARILNMRYDLESRYWCASFEPLLVQFWRTISYLLTKWKTCPVFRPKTEGAQITGGVFSRRSRSAYSRRNLSTRTWFCSSRPCLVCSIITFYHTTHRKLENWGKHEKCPIFPPMTIWTLNQSSLRLPNEKNSFN